jgi:hypothetical protein
MSYGCIARVISNALKSAEVDGRIGGSGGTQRWSQAFTRLFENALFYWVFDASLALDGDSHSLRKQVA